MTRRFEPDGLTSSAKGYSILGKDGMTRSPRRLDPLVTPNWEG